LHEHNAYGRRIILKHTPSYEASPDDQQYYQNNTDEDDGTIRDVDEGERAINN
jgi:hypothetical protein